MSQWVYLFMPKMIDIAKEFGTVFFTGDLDEPFTVNGVSGLTGIFSWQVESPETENVEISGAKKLTLTVSRLQLFHTGLTITTADIIVCRGVSYQPLVYPIDMLDGTLNIILGECTA